MSKAYDNSTAVIMYGTPDTEGELCLNVDAKNITVIAGDVKKYDIGNGSSLLCYKHGNEVIVKADGVTIFILSEEMIGRVETLEEGILFHNAYYLEEAAEHAGNLDLTLQVKENVETSFKFFPMTAETLKKATLNGTEIPLRKLKSGMLEVSFETSAFADRPEVTWTSDWKYRADSEEIKEQYDDSNWKYLEKPISLEEVDMFRHGYYWYRTTFEVADEVEGAYMSFQSNETDRFLLYINGQLVFRARNKSMDNHNITAALKPGKNTMAILYANKFHNKSHPHEGALVKYSGILHPFTIAGNYKNGEKIDITIESFSVKFELDGMDQGYQTLEYSDADWQTAPDVEKMVVGKEMGHVVWFRRHFTYNPGEGYSAPLQIIPIKADERLLIYVNGKPVAQYDIIGPQEEFYIPDAYLNKDGDNVISMVLECPGFFEEIMSGYRRGYLYNPKVQPSYVSKTVKLELTK